jgi:hypothetical protein
MTSDRLQLLIRQTLAEMRAPGFAIAPVGIEDPTGRMCFAVSFLPKGHQRIFLDLYAPDHEVIQEIRRQLKDCIPRRRMHHHFLE